MGWRTEQVLSGVARGCSTPDFQEGDELLVGENVDAAGESSMVVSTAKLYAAHWRRRLHKGFQRASRVWTGRPFCTLEI